MKSVRLILLRGAIKVKQLPVRLIDGKLFFKAVSLRSSFTVVFWILMPMTFYLVANYVIMPEALKSLAQFMQGHQENLEPDARLDGEAPEEQSPKPQSSHSLSGYLQQIFAFVILLSNILLPFLSAYALNGLSMKEIEQVIGKKSKDSFMGTAILMMMFSVVYFFVCSQFLIQLIGFSKYVPPVMSILIISGNLTNVILYYVAVSEMMFVIDLRCRMAINHCDEEDLSISATKKVRTFFNESWPDTRERLKPLFGFVYSTSAPEILIYSYLTIKNLCKSDPSLAIVGGYALTALMFFGILLLVSLFAENVNSAIQRCSQRTRERLAKSSPNQKEELEYLLEALSGAEKISVYEMFPAGMDTFASLLSFILTYLIVLLQNPVN